MPIIERQVIDYNNWLTMADFTDLITISWMTPGPIAINSATFVGLQVAGFKGALIATLGTVLPSVIIVLALAYLYYKYNNVKSIQSLLIGLHPAVSAMISSVAVSLMTFTILEDITPGSPVSFNPIGLGLFLLCFLVLRLKKKISPLALMGASSLIGAILYSLFPQF